MIIKNPMYIVGSDVRDTTATANDVLYPKTFYGADGEKKVGAIPTYAGAVSVTPNESSQTLDTDHKYLEQDIVVEPIPSEYKDTTGTDAVAGDIREGKKAVTENGLVTGTLQDYEGPTTITANGTLQVAGKYMPSNLTVKIEESDVNFYDYDGTLVAAYTAADFANLTAMPANPSHTGLVAEGWNWTLSDAKTYVASYGMLDIGQMYHTASGKTEYDIEVNEATGFTSILSGTSGTEKDWGDGTTDTLESHTYATAGSYTIKLSGTTLPNINSSKKVRAVRIASGVITLPREGFYNCKRLETISIPNSVTGRDGTGILEARIFMQAFNLKSITIPTGINTINTSEFNGCTNIRSISLPKAINKVSGAAFGACLSLRSITFQPTDIAGSQMFTNCYSLKKVNIQTYGSTNSIQSDAFNGCQSLSKIELPSTLTGIGASSFVGAASLLSITIPSSVTSIGSSAFSGCKWLRIVTVLATTPPTVASDSFQSIYITKIYIPNGTLATYTADTNWSTYASKLVELPA